MDQWAMLIDGKFVDADGPVLEVKAPYDGKVIGATRLGSWKEVDRALEAATMAFATWRKTARRDRQSLLRRIANLVRDNEANLVSLLTQEVGKPITWSKGEVTRLALTFELAADWLTSPSGQVLPVDYDVRGDGYRCLVERFPRGVVFAVTPYNWPFNLAAHKIAPALAVGGTIVMKPSRRSLLTSLELAKIIHEAGCPNGVFNAIVCDDETAERAIRDQRTQVVSFTGSEKVGWRIKSLVPDKQVTLELGGDATAVVMSDADLDWATKRIVAGKYGYAGQICISIQHVLIHRDIYDGFKLRLVDGTRRCRSGDPSDPETVCGPLIDAAAADKVEKLLNDAVSKGATVLAGGKRTGNLIEPTLLENVPDDAALVHEEVFGPLLTIRPFDTIEEAIARVNSSRFGIHCGVFTSNISTAEQFYQGLDVGGVIVNDYPTLRFDNMPYGGNKRSGFGREGIAYACEELTLPKTLLTRLVD